MAFYYSPVNNKNFKKNTIDLLLIIRNLHFILLTMFISTSGCTKEPQCNEIKVEEIITTYQGNLLDIYFKNESDGFIVGEFDFIGNRKSIMLRTDNGGDSWILDTFNITNKKVEGIGGYGNNIFIKITDMVNGSKPIFYSNDNGIIWNLYHNGMTVMPGFFDESNGISLRSLTVLRTSNSGNEWDSVYTINSMASLYFKITSSNVAYLGGGSFYDFTDFGILFKTSDKGVSWINLNWDNSNISNMSFINEDIGYLYTSSGKLLKTVDGGNSYTVINNNITDSSPGCFFITELEGFYSTHNSIFWTNDGGISWKLQFQDNNISLNNKIVFNGSGFIVGKNGIIYKLSKQH